MKLKTCPFCGEAFAEIESEPGLSCDNSEPLDIELNYSEKIYFIRCQNCGASTDGSTDLFRAVENWNVRKIPKKKGET